MNHQKKTNAGFAAIGAVGLLGVIGLKQGGGWVTPELLQAALSVVSAFTGVTFRAGLGTAGWKTYAGSLAFGLVGLAPAFGIADQATAGGLQGAIATWTGISVQHGVRKIPRAA